MRLEVHVRRAFRVHRRVPEAGGREEALENDASEKRARDIHAIRTDGQTDGERETKTVLGNVFPKRCGVVRVAFVADGRRGRSARARLLLSVAVGAARVLPLKIP